MKIEAFKAPLWGAVGGAIVMVVIGFSWGGWVTSGKASFMSSEAADVAVLARLTPICLDQYKHDVDKEAKHAALMDIKLWQRSDYVAKQGWALMPGETEVDDDVSRACASAISALDS